MNSELLSEIHRAKAERRRRLAHLPVDEKVVIIERLRDLAVSLRAARKGMLRDTGSDPIRAHP